jgi:DNA polymerase-3 subunit delta
MIIFLYGPDTFRSHRFLKDMKKKFISEIDAQSQSITEIDGSTATIQKISEQINTGSLFVKKRLIIIQDIFQNKKEKIFAELADYLKKFTSGDDNIIIFRDEAINPQNKSLKTDTKKLFSWLLKQPYTQEFKILDNTQLMSFIKKEASRYQKNITAPAASLLISLTGPDTWLIAGEIKKLSDRNNEGEISKEIIQEMVTGSFDENIFAFTDALSTKNRSLAIRLLEEQYAAGLSDEYLLTMLIRQFKILLRVKSSLEHSSSSQDLSTKLQLHPFIIKKSISQCRNFSLPDLKNYLNRLIELDFGNKRGISGLKTELTLLISEL